jgi:uncharacterized protein
VNILAVSDTQEKGLENMVLHSQGVLKNIELIISCGDLDKEYIEFLVDGLNRELFFVSGNHIGSKDDNECDDCYDGVLSDKVWDKIRSKHDRTIVRIAGRKDLHGRVVEYKNFYIAGFGGAKWYGGRSNEYSEKEMSEFVNKTIRKIKLYQLRDRFLKKQQKEIIVISHAPVFEVHDLLDECHSGFKCFSKLIKEISPSLWLHGHVHLPNNSKNQVSKIATTVIANVSGYKFIKMEHDRIDVSARKEIFK